jgi:hypothetical protein
VGALGENAGFEGLLFIPIPFEVGIPIRPVPSGGGNWRVVPVDPVAFDVPPSPTVAFGFVFPAWLPAPFEPFAGFELANPSERLF